VNRLLRGEPVAEEEYLLERHGSRRRIVAIGGSVRDEEGRVALAIVVSRDVTELRKLEELRQEYTTLISHDLRNPLTTVLGMAQLLQRTLAGKGLSQEAHLADGMAKSARRMEAMIRDLSESAQLETRQLDLHEEPTDLVGLILDLVDQVVAPADRDRIHIEAGEWVPPVLVDPQRLERAVTNVLANALKYSPSDKPVVIRVAQQDGKALVSVADQGVGIPPEDLPHLFERHFRAKTAAQREGLGLGLYITRLIVEAHGGHVSVESQVGQGSTFYFSLPLA
jgi:signal transduction histidine kinase